MSGDTSGAATAGEDHSGAGQGAVLLDIGGDVGALVVHVPDAPAGLELGIEPVPPRPGWPPNHHVGVVARGVANGVEHSAVFPALPAGDYELHRRPDGPPAVRARVRGGCVTELRWPGT